MLYSVRMRASEGKSHEEGGVHISGAEQLVKEEELLRVVNEMIKRAQNHSRGRADFINIAIEEIDRTEVKTITCLDIAQSMEASNYLQGRELAKMELLIRGVSLRAIEAAFEELNNLPISMRGAILICAKTGLRLDDREHKGVRVSRMDIEDANTYQKWLEKKGYKNNLHLKEALVLASKVISAKGIIAELCWSDDPEYVTGYVASSLGYTRISPLKPKNSSLGGRIFFVEEHTALANLINYLEKVPTQIKTPEMRKLE